MNDILNIIMVSVIEWMSVSCQLYTECRYEVNVILNVNMESTYNYFKAIIIEVIRG
jgi:hypothetical protein